MKLKLQVCFSVTDSRAEIVNFQIRIQKLNQPIRLAPQFLCLRVARIGGIHVNHKHHTKLFPDGTFRRVRNGMRLRDCHFLGKKHVDGGKVFSGSVIMNDQVVGSFRFFLAGDQCLYFIPQFRILRLSQKWRKYIPHDADARPDNQQGDKDPGKTIHMDAEQPLRRDRKNGDGCRQAVKQRVHRRGMENGGGNLFSDCIVKEIQPQLCQHSNDQQHHQHRGKAQILRVKDVLKRLAEEGDADLHNGKGNDKGRNILNPSVTEGMFLIRGLFGNSCAYQADAGGNCVGKVVYGVRRYRHGREQDADDQLDREQNQVCADSHNAGGGSVGGAHADILHIRAVFNHFIKKFPHRKNPLSDFPPDSYSVFTVPVRYPCFHRYFSDRKNPAQPVPAAPDSLYLITGIGYESSLTAIRWQFILPVLYWQRRFPGPPRPGRISS